MTDKKPLYVIKFRIIHIELKKEAPSIMGFYKKPELSIYHVICLPVSLMESQKWGWEKLSELHLEKHSDKLAESYGEDLEVFQCTIPMTRHTIETNNYEPGDIIELTVKKENKPELVTV